MPRAPQYRYLAPAHLAYYTIPGTRPLAQKPPNGVTDEWSKGYRQCQEEMLELIRKARLAAQQDYKQTISETLKAIDSNQI